MNDWSSRPFEERNLFNPAFCALVLASAIRAYKKEAKEPMPYSLCLLVLPMCLHHETRNEICANKKVSILRTIARRPDLLVDFCRRAQGLLNYATEAFALLAIRNCVEVDEAGGVAIRPGKLADKPLPTQDAELCRTAASVLGRDFGRVGDPATVYTSLSIRP